MIRHHPETELLLEYIAGSLAQPVSLVVASHACLCAACRAQAARFEAVGGALLDGLEPAQLSENLLDATLARLDDAGAEPDKPATAPRDFDDDTRKLIPAPVRPYLAGNFDNLGWRWQGRTLREARLPLGKPGYRTSLFRLRPGASPPAHGHVGNEYTLVLAGSFTEDGEVYGVGDFAHYDKETVHIQTAEAEEGCICLTVLDAPVRLRGALGRLVNPFLRF